MRNNKSTAVAQIQNGMPEYGSTPRTAPMVRTTEMGVSPTTMPQTMTRVRRRDSASGARRLFRTSETRPRAIVRHQYRMTRGPRTRQVGDSTMRCRGAKLCARPTIAINVPRTTTVGTSSTYLSHGARRSIGDCAGKIAKNQYSATGTSPPSSLKQSTNRRSAGCSTSSSIGAAAMRLMKSSVRSQAVRSCGRCSRTTAATIRNAAG